MTVHERNADVEVAAAVLGDLAVAGHPLAPLTTYRVGGTAALFVDAHSADDLAAVARARAASGLPVLVVGRGSNLLVADEGFVGIAVSVTGFADDIEIGTPGSTGDVVVVAGGGVALPVLARRTAAAGVTGFEWAVGVPGSIGGAVRMNAGGHGSDIAASLIDVDLVDLDAASVDAPGTAPDTGWGATEPFVTRRSASSLGLRFRGSDITDTQVVVRARLALQTGDRETAERTIAEIVRWRREHQPGGQNCGSVFVNPVPGEVSAGELVDRLGLRGFRIGTAAVSDKHTNFVQAGDGGTAADVRAVIEAVRRRVAEGTGYELRSEVRLVGFDEDEPA